jgi:hypothetical protein
VLSVGFEAMARATANINPKIGLRSIHVVGEATHLPFAQQQQPALSFFAKTDKG